MASSPRAKLGAEAVGKYLIQGSNTGQFLGTDELRGLELGARGASE